MQERNMGIDPSQIAGTPEWKLRVQAEAAGRMLRNISGIGQVSKTTESNASRIRSEITDPPQTNNVKPKADTGKKV